MCCLVQLTHICTFFSECKYSYSHCTFGYGPKMFISGAANSQQPAYNLYKADYASHYFLRSSKFSKANVSLPLSGRDIYTKFLDIPTTNICFKSLKSNPNSLQVPFSTHTVREIHISNRQKLTLNSTSPQREKVQNGPDIFSCV